MPASRPKVQTLVATKSLPARPSSAESSPTTCSAAPYIGEASTTVPPSSTSVRKVSRAAARSRPLRGTSNASQVPSPTAGMRSPVRGIGRVSIVIACFLLVVASTRRGKNTQIDRAPGAFRARVAVGSFRTHPSGCRRRRMRAQPLSGRAAPATASACSVSCEKATGRASTDNRRMDRTETGRRRGSTASRTGNMRREPAETRRSAPPRCRCAACGR